MTTAERQRQYRKRKAEAGLIKKDVWTDRTGLLASPAETGAWRQMTLKELGKEISKIFPEEKGWEREVVYAELYAYAKHIEQRIKNALYNNEA